MFATVWWIAAIILDIFAISHVMNSGRDTFSKIVLIAVILLVPVFAAGIYLLVFRDKGYAV
ncbi:MAG TPA: PLDc N-terminal domain-containing protein [Blastocatellia bacterium]|nr:PLDc N-terminal domain-containing protein [Blastocatellia bacterium]